MTHAMFLGVALIIAPAVAKSDMCSRAPLSCAKAGQCINLPFKAERQPESFYALSAGQDIRPLAYLSLSSSDSRLYQIERLIPWTVAGELQDRSAVVLYGWQGNSFCQLLWYPTFSKDVFNYQPRAIGQNAPVPKIAGYRNLAVADTGASGRLVGIWRGEHDTLIVSFNKVGDPELRILGQSLIRWASISLTPSIDSPPIIRLMSEAKPGETIHFATYELII